MLDLHNNFTNACCGKRNATSKPIMYEHSVVDHVARGQYTTEFKLNAGETHMDREPTARSTPADVSKQSNIQAACGLVNDSQSSSEPIFVRTNSGVDKLIGGMKNDLTNSSWYEPRRAEPANLFGVQDAQISERYKHYDARLASFTSPRWPSDVPVPADELARAGWYFTGVTDRVKCPWCHGCVYNWVDGDTALGEHKRHYPQCVFVKQHIAAAFQKPQLLSKASAPKRQRVVTRDTWRESSAVQAVQELEIYADDVIERAVQHLLASRRKSALYYAYFFFRPGRDVQCCLCQLHCSERRLTSLSK